MRSLVTGASGYLGRSLVPALLARGHDVSVSVFRGEVLAGVSQSVRGDLSDPKVRARLDELLPDTDVVVHLAGIAHQRATASEYQVVNVETTIDLGERAKAAGVRRFIYVSSIKAADAATTESTPPLRKESVGASPYAVSKLRAEAALRDLCNDGSMELSIVRPALVYGDNEVGHLALLKRWVLWRLPPPPDLGSLAMIGRRDLVDLLCVIAEHQGDVPALVTATDGQRYSTRRLYAAFCQAFERRSPLPSPPLWIWRGAANLWDRMRGDRSGSTWERLAGDSFAPAAGHDGLPFSAQLTFEASIGGKS